MILKNALQLVAKIAFLTLVLNSLYQMTTSAGAIGQSGPRAQRPVDRVCSIVDGRATEHSLSAMGTMLKPESATSIPALVIHALIFNTPSLYFIIQKFCTKLRNSF